MLSVVKSPLSLGVTTASMRKVDYFRVPAAYMSSKSSGSKSSGVFRSKRRQNLKPQTLPAHLSGFEILQDPLYNKGTAFPSRERDRFSLRGLFPARIFTLEEQVDRTYLGFKRQSEFFERQIMRQDIAEEDRDSAIAELEIEKSVLRYEYLAQLKDRNEVLYYRLLSQYIEECAPIVYTPTIGVACQRAGSIFRRPRGLYISLEDKGSIHAVVGNCPMKSVDLTVMTDGSRILGLGDLGAHGMAIPIGKLSLYTAGAGLDPAKCLPIMIDVGTNNKALREDPLYLGLKQKRLEGEAFYEFMDEVVDALITRWPNIMLHFEDFRNPSADDLLERYRHDLFVFNDDIQGTGAMALSALMSAIRVKGLTSSAIKDQKIVCLGGGSAGIGVCDAVLNGMIHEGASEEEARAKFWVLDVDGLIGQDRGDKLLPGQDTFARKDMESGMSFEDVIELVKPDILLGLTGIGGTFTEKALRTMGKHNDQPIVFAMSNPTKNAECTAEQAYEYTDGKCLFAGGSPFPPVKRDGKVVMTPSQANNMYVFPGLGLGTISTKCTRVTDGMLYVAAKTVAECLSEEDIRQKQMFPRIRDIQEVSLRLAVAVAEQAEKEGVARYMPEAPTTLREYMEHEFMWKPEYKNLVQDVYGNSTPM